MQIRHRHATCAAILIVTSVFGVPLVRAQGIVAGPEIRVDGPDDVQPGTGRNVPDGAVDNLGRRIHVWAAFTDTRMDVFLRRFDASGNPLEDPKLVNSTTEDNQTLPRIAVAGDGSFLVVFQSDEFDPDVGVDRVVIRSQAFNANGNPIGLERKLNTVRTSRATDAFADVAALRTVDGSSGGYAVVWASSLSAGTDSNTSVQGCTVAAGGMPGPQFQVNFDEPGSQDYPSVTELADGGFLATWTSFSQLVGRRFDAAGNPDGNDFVISTAFVEQKLANDAAIGWDGTVAVVWADAELSGNDREIRARLFDADLVPLGPDFRVNTVITNEQSEPRVADYGPKGFLVAWASDDSAGTDVADSIEARLVTGPNAFGGPQVQFNIWDGNGSNQNHPAAHGWYGRLGTSWRSHSRGGNPPPVPNTSDHILGRNIEDCLFCDDVEWGSSWRWSVTQN